MVEQSNDYAGRPDGTEEYRFAVIKGTKEQVETAEELVLHHVQEFKKLRNRANSEDTGVSGRKTQVLLPSKSMHSVSNYQDIISLGDAEFVKQLNLTLNGQVEVFVSCVYDPNLFWIQSKLSKFSNQCFSATPMNFIRDTM